MGKSILVIDKPETCLDCRFCRKLQEGIEACCELSDEPNDKELYRNIETDYCQEKPDWCPLRDFPKELDENETYMDCEYYRAQGFNACIDEILRRNGDE